MQDFQDTVGRRLGIQETAWSPTDWGEEDRAAEPARLTKQENESAVEERGPRLSSLLLGIMSAADGKVVPTASTATEQASTASDSDDNPPSSPSPPYSLPTSPVSLLGGFQDGESADDTLRELGGPTCATPGEMPGQKAQHCSLPLRMGQCQHGPCGCPTFNSMIIHTQSTHTPGAACGRPPRDGKNSPGDEVARRTQHSSPGPGEEEAQPQYPPAQNGNTACGARRPGEGRR